MRLKTGSLLRGIVLAAASLFVVAGCKKSSNSSSNNNNSEQMTAMIGSTTFQTNTVVGEYSQAASLYEVGGYSIKSGDTAILSVYFNPPQQILVPVSSDTAFIDVEYEDSKTGLTYNGGQLGGGRSILTILALDTVLLKVNGTFSGILYNTNGTSDSVAVTNGQFSSTYIIGP
jgi:hypothetical protein